MSKKLTKAERRQIIVARREGRRVKEDPIVSAEVRRNIRRLSR